uniref:Uncharacterized protein n=1 Tax=viral metagenome TaxID=1070528 RepID=A0A6M3JFD2_9ZZZZ
MKSRIIRFIIEWLWKHHKYLVMDVVVPAGSHFHRNPRKRPTAVVNFPREGVEQ